MLGSSCGEAPSHLGAEGNALHGEYIKDLTGQGGVSVCISIHSFNISSAGIRVKVTSTEGNGYGVIQEELGCPLERKHVQQSFGQNQRLFNFSRVGVWSIHVTLRGTWVAGNFTSEFPKKAFIYSGLALERV